MLRVPEPIKNLLAVTESGYSRQLYKTYKSHQSVLKAKALSTNPNIALLYLGAIPVSFATKSIIAPVVYILGARALIYNKMAMSPENCFWTRLFSDSEKRNERARRRETVMRAIYLG